MIDWIKVFLYGFAFAGAAAGFSWLIVKRKYAWIIFIMIICLFLVAIATGFVAAVCES